MGSQNIFLLNALPVSLWLHFKHFYIEQQYKLYDLRKLIQLFMSILAKIRDEKLSRLITLP